MLLLRRVLYGICVILSLIFISFRGGNLPYMLFFMMLLNTIAAIIYILYVFFTIKIYQVIPERRVTKCEFVSYHLMLHNESLIAYRDIRLHFTRELSEVKGTDKIGCIGMEPGQGMNVSGELFCKYSGTYFVGVDSIEIMDYFKIFRIRFQMPQKMKVTVKPRVISLDSLNFLKEEESHDSSLFGRSEYRLDNEVRKYYPGDNKRSIHWKNSAKRQELLVRTPMAEEVSEYVVVMDGSMGKIPLEEKIICCDKLREATLALVHYIYSSGYKVWVLLDGVNQKEIVSRRDFTELYERLIDYGFGQEKKIGERFEEILKSNGEEIPVILVTSSHSVMSQEDAGRVYDGRNVYRLNVDSQKTVEEIFQMEN